MDDDDLDGALAQMLAKGEVDRTWNATTGQWEYALTEKGQTAAAELIKKLTRKN